jgi:hypothetical protein
MCADPALTDAPTQDEEGRVIRCTRDIHSADTSKMADRHCAVDAQDKNDPVRRTLDMDDANDPYEDSPGQNEDSPVQSIGAI